MTKKDFEALARAFASVKPTPNTSNPAESLWEQAVEAVADVCQESNPRFNRSRFFAACEGHKRGDGWKKLVQRVLDTSEEDKDESR